MRKAILSAFLLLALMLVNPTQTQAAAPTLEQVVFQNSPVVFHWVGTTTLLEAGGKVFNVTSMDVSVFRVDFSRSAIGTVGPYITYDHQTPRDQKTYYVSGLVDYDADGEVDGLVVRTTQWNLGDPLPK